ncbi:hypothetical protein [Bordetella trematum]|uniref:hypothetical protein n=1 Tax=Bordetella trematum TaxID=123899 RepID=UPI000D97FA02|nr:hypothetical protein [Bordetella trematum]SPU54190.1 Uncharacterised protein [Bordetella trematum]VDH08205.1 Uncharacterised protein [Bordetella trematum]
MNTLTAPADAAITILAEQGPQRIGFDAVQAYHGHGALAMLALVFQGLRGALPLLQDGDTPIARAELRVTSGHPGPGVRDAFEFVTRAVTRGCYEIDLDLPQARYSPGADKSYSFILQRGPRSVCAVLRPEVLPADFFTLMRDTSPQGQQVHAALRARIGQAALQASPQALYTFTQG